MSAAGEGRLQATAAENGLLSSAPASRLSLLPEDSSSQAPGSAVGVHCGCVNGDSQSWLGTEKEDSGSRLLQGLVTPRLSCFWSRWEGGEGWSRQQENLPLPKFH